MTPRGIAHLIEAAAGRLGEFKDPLLDAELLFRGVSGLTRASLLAHPDQTVPPAVATAFEAAVARRERHEPIQYILGAASFWRDEFVVSPAVLIPRPDTETLVEAVAVRLGQLDRPSLLDLGTGSGCVALSLLRELRGARAVGVDISEEALEVARQNALRLGLDSRICLRLSSWWEAVPPTESFDAVVSNPPYIATGDAPFLPKDVRDHEPAVALFADPADDLSSYRAIVSGLGGHLKAEGLLAFEVGAGQADRVARLLTEQGFGSIEVLNDLTSIPRVVLGRR